MSEYPDPIPWLLESDVSIQYQTHRSLLREHRLDLRERIGREGWGARFLSCQNSDGSWGRGFYQPKWTSTHYTLLDLRGLEISPECDAAVSAVRRIAKREKGPDGGINPAGSVAESDVCINGMFLNYASYFGLEEEELQSVVDFILSQRMEDGGFNCRRNRSGARHSSLHSTLSVLEGCAEYQLNGYSYRLEEIKETARGSEEFILSHRLYRSDHTGAVIHKSFLTLSYPPRWKYNILRCMDHFRRAGVHRDRRMSDALSVIESKRRPDGRWPLQAAIPGLCHFSMEEPRQPSRWNTLLALRVLDAYRQKS